MYKIMLVDDHEIVRDGVKRLLNRELVFDVVESLGSISEMFKALNHIRTDLILLDLKLDDGDGVSAAVQLKRQFPNTKILILSGYIEPSFAQEAKKIGIEGYILKSIDAKLLISTIHKVLEGHIVYDPKVEELLESTVSDSLKKLSNQEYQLIRLIALGKTSKEISFVMGIAEKTVRNYTSRLYQKINVSSRSEAVAYYMRNR